MANENGFTLVEIIASLVIVGIMATVAGFWMVLGAQGYNFSRENSVIAQKAGLTLARLGRELTELTEVDSVNSDGSCIRYKVGAISPYYRAIGLNGTLLELKVSSASDCDCSTPGFTLTDNVSGFTLKYEDAAGTSPIPSTPPANLGDLAAIHVDFTFSRSDGTDTETFKTAVNPRNNGTPNGPGAL